MQKKTLVKGCLIIWLLSETSEEEHQAYGGDHAENRRRTNLAVSLKIDVEEYFKQPISE